MTPARLLIGAGLLLAVVAAIFLTSGASQKYTAQRFRNAVTDDPVINAEIQRSRHWRRNMWTGLAIGVVAVGLIGAGNRRLDADRSSDAPDASDADASDTQTDDS